MTQRCKILTNTILHSLIKKTLETVKKIQKRRLAEETISKQRHNTKKIIKIPAKNRRIH